MEGVACLSSRTWCVAALLLAVFDAVLDVGSPLSLSLLRRRLDQDLVAERFAFPLCNQKEGCVSLFIKLWLQMMMRQSSVSWERKCVCGEAGSVVGTHLRRVLRVGD